MINKKNFNKNIYAKKHITEAINAYRNLCSIKIVENDNYYELFMEHYKANPNLIWCEFENYLIGLGGQHGF